MVSQSPSELSAVANSFYQIKNGKIPVVASNGNETLRDVEYEIVSLVRSIGYSKTFAPQTRVLLPVLSSALGNCIEFAWKFKDNYSAGVSSTYQTGSKGDNEVSGYFGAEVTYGDYYGRMYYQILAFGRNAFTTLQDSLALPNDSNQIIVSVISTPNDAYHIVRKDNREIPNQCYSIEYVTDIKGIVIGSALSRSNPMVGGLLEDKDGNPCYAELYVLSSRVNQFSIDALDLSGATRVLEYNNANSNTTSLVKIVQKATGYYLSFSGAAAPVAGKAWAIVTKRYLGKPETLEDEDGNVDTITPTYGGELLIAQNIDINAGDIVGEFNIVPTHDIFEFMKKEN